MSRSQETCLKVVRLKLPVTTFHLSMDMECSVDILGTFGLNLCMRRSTKYEGSALHTSKMQLNINPMLTRLCHLLCCFPLVFCIGAFIKIKERLRGAKKYERTVFVKNKNSPSDFY